MTTPQSSSLPAASLQALHAALRRGEESFDTIVAFYRDRLQTADEEEIVVQLYAALTTNGDPRATASILIAAARREARKDQTT